MRKHVDLCLQAKHGEATIFKCFDLADFFAEVLDVGFFIGVSDGYAGSSMVFLLVEN